MPMMPMMGAGMAGKFPASLGDMAKGAGKGQSTGPFGGMVKPQGQGGFVSLNKPGMAKPPTPGPAPAPAAGGGGGMGSNLASIAQRFIQMQNARKAAPPPAAAPPTAAEAVQPGGGEMRRITPMGGPPPPAGPAPGAPPEMMGGGGGFRRMQLPEASAYGPAGGPEAPGAMNSMPRQNARMMSIMQMLRPRPGGNVAGAMGRGGFTGGIF